MNETVNNTPEMNNLEEALMKWATPGEIGKILGITGQQVTSYLDGKNGTGMQGIYEEKGMKGTSRVLALTRKGAGELLVKHNKRLQEDSNKNKSSPPPAISTVPEIIEENPVRYAEFKNKFRDKTGGFGNPMSAWEFLKKNHSSLFQQITDTNGRHNVLLLKKSNFHTAMDLALKYNKGTTVGYKKIRKQRKEHPPRSTLSSENIAFLSNSGT